MDKAPSEAGLPPSLRLLKWLVIVLTLTMIGGVIAVVGLLVTRMPAAMHTTFALPEQIFLPEGTTAQAFTQGGGWYAVVTTDDRILIFNRKTGTLVQEITLSPEAKTP